MSRGGLEQTDKKERELERSTVLGRTCMKPYIPGLYLLLPLLFQFLILDVAGYYSSHFTYGQHISLAERNEQ